MSAERPSSAVNVSAVLKQIYPGEPVAVIRRALILRSLKNMGRDLPKKNLNFFKGFQPAGYRPAQSEAAEVEGSVGRRDTLPSHRFSAH